MLSWQCLKGSQVGSITIVAPKQTMCHFHISLFRAAPIPALWRLPREKADTQGHR